MVPDASSGLFALGGVALAELARGVHGWRERSHARGLRSHNDQREDDARWLDDRRRVHVQFLEVATAWQDDLEQMLSSLNHDWADPPEDPDAQENAVNAAVSALELVAGDESHKYARAWSRSLSKASIRATLYEHAEAPERPEQIQRMAAHLDKAGELRRQYVKAARDELGTTRRQG